MSQVFRELRIPPFEEGCDVGTLPTREVVNWMKGSAGGRLFLPPIQRSLVWRNSQIVNYWDSLLRGYPAGMMLVHRSSRDTWVRTENGETREASSNSFQLFDGQQRMSAILLGHGAGQLHDYIRLWVDLGTTPTQCSGLKFQIRVSSTGQPFGYQADSPNSKFPLRQRRHWIEKWKEEHPEQDFRSAEVFREMMDGSLIGAKAPFPLNEAVKHLIEHSIEHCLKELESKYYASPAKIREFVYALDGALKREITFQRIDEEIVNSEEEYIRFFGRLGQGGTALSQDELTYSIIKHQYPEVHDRMIEIMAPESAGRMMSEVDLVLGVLRVAKTRAPQVNTKGWEIIGRPHPGFISQMRGLSVENEFRKFIPISRGGRLKELMETVRKNLVYHPTDNRAGLPVMLFARFPHQLVDVLLLFASTWVIDGNPKPKVGVLSAFVLHWLLFVGDSEKAAKQAFFGYLEKGPLRDTEDFRKLIQVLEQLGISRPLPTGAELVKLRRNVKKGDSRLRNWEERFNYLDVRDGRLVGESLRMLSSHRELVMRVLLWLQRDSLTAAYSDFDPTSTKDEDLPIDLDHLIPDSVFRFDWRHCEKRLSHEIDTENFRSFRGLLGNSLGNYRWLDASTNRSRKNDRLEGTVDGSHHIENPECWDRLIGEKCWNQNDVAELQRLIDLRSLSIFEKVLHEGRVELIVPTQASQADSES